MPRHRVALIGHFGVWRDFLDAIEQRRPPRVSGAEALKVHRLIDAPLTAGTTGRTVVPIG